jgi:hypothetical protein
MTVSDITSSLSGIPDKPEGAESEVASASSFFSDLLQPCSFEPVLATAYFFFYRCSPYTTLFFHQPTSQLNCYALLQPCRHGATVVLRQLRVVPFILSHSRDAKHHPEDYHESIGIVDQPNAVVFLLLHNHHLVPRTEDKHCVGIICRGGMTLIIRLSLLGLCNRACASYIHPAVSSFEAISLPLRPTPVPHQ